MRIKSLFIKGVVTRWIRMYIKDVNGLNNFSRDHPYLIVCNHNSIFDSLAISAVFIKHTSRIVGVVAKIKSSKNTFCDRILVGISKRLANFFVDIISVLKHKVVEITSHRLRKGKNIMIFPEGRNNRGKELLPCKSGAARIAIMSKIPVLPVGIINSEKIIPQNKYLPRFRRMTVNIGEPLTFEDYYDKDVGKKEIDEVTRKIMEKVAELCHKKYPY